MTQLRPDAFRADVQTREPAALADVLASFDVAAAGARMHGIDHGLHVWAELSRVPRFRGAAAALALSLVESATA